MPLFHRAGATPAHLGPATDLTGTRSLTDEARAAPGLVVHTGALNGRTVKVHARTFTGLKIAEQVLVDVRARCIPWAGNQRSEVQRTGGWSWARARAARSAEMQIKDSQIGRKAALAIRYQGGNCNQFATVSFVRTAEQIEQLAARDPAHPLLERTLCKISSGQEGHSIVVWGKRSGKRWDAESIVIDPWAQLPTAHTLKEASADIHELIRTGTIDETYRYGATVGWRPGTETEDAIRAAKVSDAEIAAYMARQHPDMPNVAGPDLVRFVEDYHANSQPLWDEVTSARDVSTIYRDKHGREARFDHLDPRLLPAAVGDPA
jgi:hypothetical protein